jgi:seryl-tRNA synthetase
MLDVRIVRENTKKVQDALKKRNYDLSVLDKFLKIENERRELLKLIEEKREQRNKVSQEIAKLKREKKDASSILAEAKNISDFIAEQDERLKVLEDCRGKVLSDEGSWGKTRKGIDEFYARSEFVKRL